ncbi:MAG: ribonuclease activity regulator RraA [Candidatus Bathyarchaeia archaeon]
MESIRVERPSKRLIRDLAEISSATAWGVLSEMGITSTFMRGILPLTPGMKMVGPAQTLHYVPMREDKKYTYEWFRMSAPFRLSNETQEGDVIVVDAGGVGGYGGMGDIMITAYAVKKAGGMVFDGAIRDSPYARTLNMPIFCRGAQPSTTPHIMPVAANIMVQCGGVLVVPGDVLIGDDDGVVVIPKEKIEEVAKKGLEHEQIEAYSRKILEAGKPLSEAYPPKQEWLTKPPL